MNYFKKGQLTLEGEENVNGKPAYKLKVNVSGSPLSTCISIRVPYLLVKTNTTVDQMGTSMNVDSYYD